MASSQFQIGITLDGETVQQFAEMLAKALYQHQAQKSEPKPPMTPIERSQHAMFGGKKPPENLGLLLTTKETAKLLKVSERTIFAMSHGGKMPKPIRIGQSVRFSYEELRAWVNAGCPKQAEWRYSPDSQKPLP